MDLQPSSPTASAEELFADFLDRIEEGGTPDFAAFCEAHPAKAETLQRLHVRWQAMARAFTELSRQPDAETSSASSPSLDTLMVRLATRGGRLDRYALGSEIARGAMGRIVTAWDEELRREVALKIHRGPVNDSRQQRRFLEEAQIAAQLDHPGIVPIHELGIDDDGRPFFSMQLVRGRDLGQILLAVQSGDDEWSRTRVLHVLLRVCEAMAFAHEKGVVHRDLKPANIMVGRFGETYVMDWGLARVHGGAADRASAAVAVDSLRADIADEDAGSALLTHQGDVVGTPAYMAPEQAAVGSATAAPAIDIYSVGTILYHLLAGNMPYAGGSQSADDVLRALRAGPPKPLSDDVPAELRAICERAMMREPTARYADMAALASDLRAFLEVRTVRAYATGRFAELRKWVARNRTLTLVCAALVAAMVVGSIAVTALWVQAEADRARADASASRLLTELDRSAFHSARQSLQLDNSSEAADALWRAHFAGRMPRATSWALLELAERDPYLVTLPIHGDAVPVAISKRANVVLVGGGDGRLQVRDPETLALRAELGERGPGLTSVMAPDDATWAVAGTREGTLLVFDLVEQRFLHRDAAHTGSVRNIVATGGNSFVTGGADGRVLLFAEPKATPRALLTHEHGITALTATVASHHGTAGVMAGDEHGTLRGIAFDGSWRLHRSFGDTRLTALAHSTESNELWVGGTDHHVRCLNLTDPTRDRSLPTRNGTCRQLVRDRDGSLLVGGWWRTDRLSADGATFSPLALRGVSRVAFDAQRRRLVTTGVTSGLGIVDVAVGDRRPISNGSGLTMSHDGTRIATVEHNRVVVREVDSQRLVTRLAAGRVGWLQLDADGTHVAVTTQKPSRVQVYELATGKVTCTSDGPLDAFGDACVFSPDGSELAVRVGSEHIRRLQKHDGEVLAEYGLPGARWHRLAYSADGRSLAAIHRTDATVRICDLGTGAHRDVVFAPESPGGTPLTLAAVALSPDGSTVAVGTWQGGILVRRADGSTATLTGHAGTVWSLQFAAHDPGLLFSSGGSQGIAAWDLDAMECCYQTVPDMATNLQVSRDGRTLACILPTGGLLIDLSYRSRHLAGNLSYHLDRLRAKVDILSARETQLRAWAADVLARPWPRWQ